MNEVYQVQLSRADYAAGLSALMAELAQADTARAPMLFGRLAVCVVTLSIVAFAFPYSLPGLPVACMLIWAGDWLVRAAFETRTVGVSFDPAVHADVRIAFGDDAIVEQGALRTRRWTWEAVRRVHLSSDHVIVELRGWDMIVLPSRLWSTNDARDAFLAQLEARRFSDGTRAGAPSTREAEARMMLIEPVLVARISLLLAAFQLTLEAQPPEASADRTAMLATLALASLAGAAMWWASGKTFQWLAARSARAALRTAWGVFLILGTAFALWPAGRIEACRARLRAGPIWQCRHIRPNPFLPRPHREQPLARVEKQPTAK